MRGFSKHVFLTLLFMILASCGTSPPVRYYALEARPDEVQMDAKDATVIGLGPLQIADYLNRPQMVTRHRGTEVSVHDFARWVEPLGQSIHAILANNVDHQLKDIIVMAYPFINMLDVNYRIVGRIDRFDANEAGLVLLTVQWALIDAQQNTLLAPVRKTYETQAKPADDPDAIASAMSTLLARLGEDIAKDIEPVIKD